MIRSDTTFAPSRRKVFFCVSVFLFLAILPYISSSCMKKSEKPERIVGAAYIEEVLAEAESYGNTEKALEFLTSEWDRTPSQRLSDAVTNLIRSQWKETRRIATYLKDGEEVPFLRYESAYDENGNLTELLSYSFDPKYAEFSYLHDRVEYVCDGDGALISEIRYVPAGNMSGRIDYEYAFFPLP